MRAVALRSRSTEPARETLIHSTNEAEPFLKQGGKGEAIPLSFDVL
jgi:hypothetical protein